MKYIFYLSIIFTFSCSTFSHKREISKEKHGIKIGKSLQAHAYDNIYFSGQPSLKDLGFMKAQGFSHIINLRTEKEHDVKGEQKRAQELEISYTHIPLAKGDELTDEFISKVTQAVMSHRKEGKTLVHCGNGGRASLWVGGHFHKDHKYSKQESQDIARRMGMKSESSKAKLNKYLESK